jgi:hypothetical protein
VARLPGSVLLDGIYHITSRGVAQAPIYLDAADCKHFVRLLRSTIWHWRWTPYAVCLMATTRPAWLRWLRRSQCPLSA